MIQIYFLSEPAAWVIPWILQAIAYFFILRKMGLKKKACIIPFLAEREMCSKLYPRRRTFYRPFIIAAVLVLAGWYLDPSAGLGRLFMIIALIIYGFFLLRLYRRLCKGFGKGKLFYLFLIFLSALFLLILGLGRSRYQPLQLKPIKDHGRFGNAIRKFFFVAVSAIEIMVLVLGVGFITIRNTPPLFVVSMESSSFDKSIKDVKADDEVLSREDLMGNRASALNKMKPSRPLFYPDHSNDKDAVVFTYIVGSNLEHAMGFASANIRQMIDATKEGSNLKFVIQAGGSKRWFTRGIKDSSYGRYEIADGKLAKVKSLPSDTCMADEEALEDFLTWGAKKYEADRHMLILWDHGGGLAYGYGEDYINNSRDKDSKGTIMASELVDAVKASGLKYDLIGFDACLMQDIEIAAALEPYADYYMASEETEGGYGWHYTDAFGKLAKDPGISTQEFGKALVSTYDQVNTILKDDGGKPDTKFTLSLVDTTMARPALDRLEEFLGKTEEAVREDSGAYASVAAAGTNAYNFSDGIQIDLVDYLSVLGRSDYDNRICSDEELQDVIDRVQSCVIYRNKDSAEGINGIAFAFPYQSITAYDPISKELRALSHKDERSAFNVIFSIMAVQQKKAMEDEDYADRMEAAGPENSSAVSMTQSMGFIDYTEQDWYVKGFEDYDTTRALVDIPLKESDEGYIIEAPEKVWDIVSDAQLMVYRGAGNNSDNMVYLGRDYIGSEDEEGHPAVASDGTWVHINGQPVCYEASPVKETSKGDIYSGKVKAKLNEKRNIILNVEWEPVKEGEEPKEAKITGYQFDSGTILGSILNARGNRDLKAGDSIQFVFETYDGEGNLVKTETSGKKIRITKQSRLKATDEPIEDSKVFIGGVLTDIYQRTMTTELVELEPKS